MYYLTEAEERHKAGLEPRLSDAERDYAIGYAKVRWLKVTEFHPQQSCPLARPGERAWTRG